MVTFFDALFETNCNVTLENLYLLSTTYILGVVILIY